MLFKDKNRGEVLSEIAILLTFFGLLSYSTLAASQTPSTPPQKGVAVLASEAVSEDAASLPSAVVGYVRMTLHRHPELLQAEAQSRFAESQVKEANAQRGLRLVLSANAGLQTQKLDASNTTNKYEQTQGQLRAFMPLIDQGLSAQLEQRRQQSNSSDWRLVDKREDLMLRTLEAYAELLRATALHKLSQENLAMHRDYVQQIKAIARLDLGRASDLPAAMSRVALAESVNTSRLARVEQSRIEFQALTGLSQVPEMPALRGFVPAQSLDEAYQAALKASPALQVARADIESARYGVSLAKAPYAPKINLDSSVKNGRDWGGVKGQQSDTYLGVQAEWAVWSGGVTGHAVRAATETEVAARYAFEKARDELHTRVSSAWFDFLAQSQSVNSYTDYVEHTKAMVDVSRKQFKIGRRNLLDVLNAESELFTARSNKLSSELDQIKSALRLTGLQGQLPEALGF